MNQKKKDLLLLATKLILKIPDVTNAKQKISNIFEKL